jgi:hypothetical protein
MTPLHRPVPPPPEHVQERARAGAVVQYKFSLLTGGSSNLARSGSRQTYPCGDADWHAYYFGDDRFSTSIHACTRPTATTYAWYTGIHARRMFKLSGHNGKVACACVVPCKYNMILSRAKGSLASRYGCALLSEPMTANWPLFVLVPLLIDTNACQQVAGAGFYAWVFKRWSPCRPACALCAAPLARRPWSVVARARRLLPLDASRSLGFVGSGNWGKERVRASLRPCVRE